MPLSEKAMAKRRASNKAYAKERAKDPVHRAVRYQKHKEWLENSVRTDPKKLARHKLRRRLNRYGLKPADWEKKLQEQGGGCAICGDTGRLCVDHCHKTGQIRGILCFGCNTALGGAKDDIGLLLAAIEYLRKGAR